MSVTNIAKSALLSYQRALTTVGNNIANVNTEGYSRQTTEFKTQSSIQQGNNFVGSGVTIDSITRNSDQFANTKLRESNTDKMRYETFSQQALQIDRLLAQDGTSISKAMQSFYSSLDTVNEAPDSSAARGVFIEQSRFMVSQFNSMQEQLKDFQTNATNQISGVINKINDIAVGIAGLNNSIASVSGEPPELLDQRDNLLAELAGLTKMSFTKESDGSLNVFIGQGQAVVNGGRATQLSAGPSADGIGTDISIVTGSNRTSVISNMKGGALQGLRDYESGIVNQSRQMIGQMAIGLAISFNEQHQLGLDLNNNLGGEFFNDFNSSTMATLRVTPAPFNTNTFNAELSMTIDDVTQTEVSDYQVVVGGGNVTIKRLSDNVEVVSGAALPQTFDGYTLSTSAALTNGDQFTLRPLTDAAEYLSLEITSPQALALSGPIRGDATLSNTGEGTIEVGVIPTTALTNPDFLDNVTINITSVNSAANTFTYDFIDNTNGSQTSLGNGPQALGEPLTLAGLPYPITIGDTPDVGDTFTLQRNNGGQGDNTNGVRLTDFQTLKTFASDASGTPTESIYDRYSSLIASVGGQAFQSNLRFDTASVIYEQALEFQQSKAGVNLDEEAANLLQLQQAYQAAGQLVSVSNRVIDILFDSL